MSGVLQNPDWQAKVHGEAASVFLPNVEFTSFDIGASVRTNDSISISGLNPSVIRQKFTYTGLPSGNGDFGNKLVTMTCSGPVASTQKARVQVFFDKNATNHPDPDAPSLAARTPNWFYYWRQTAAGLGFEISYGGSNPNYTGQTFWYKNKEWISVAKAR